MAVVAKQRKEAVPLVFIVLLMSLRCYVLHED
jgi:hypothetical protein